MTKMLAILTRLWRNFAPGDIPFVREEGKHMRKRRSLYHELSSAMPCHSAATLRKETKLFNDGLTMLIREVGTMLDFKAKDLRGVLRFHRDELLEWLETNWDHVGEAVMYVEAQQNMLLIPRHGPAGDEDNFSGDLSTLF
jgi:hypothetical protein